MNNLNCKNCNKQYDPEYMEKHVPVCNKRHQEKQNHFKIIDIWQALLEKYEEKTLYHCIVDTSIVTMDDIKYDYAASFPTHHFLSLYKPVSDIACVCKKSGPEHIHYIGERMMSNNAIMYRKRKWKIGSNKTKAISLQNKILDDKNHQVDDLDNNQVNAGSLLRAICYIQTAFDMRNRSFTNDDEGHKHFDHWNVNTIGSDYYRRTLLREAVKDYPDKFNTNYEVYQKQMDNIFQKRQAKDNYFGRLNTGDPNFVAPKKLCLSEIKANILKK